MNVEQERSRSLWMDLPAIDLPPLPRDVSTDVLVIGAGIAGLSAAYELALSGREVTVVDRGRPARGMSARTSAHLAFELDDFFYELVRARDMDAARHYYTSQAAAVDRIEEIATGAGIDCDFARVDGLLVPAVQEDIESLRKEFRAARDAGFDDIEWLDAGPGPWAPWPALRFPRQARFHPLKYLYGLLALLRSRGVQVHGYTAVTELDEQNGQVLARCASGRQLTAKAVIVATNSPFHLHIPIHTKQAPYRTYVLAGQLPQGQMPDALVWDTLDPGYHYVRIQPGDGHDVLIVGRRGPQDWRRGRHAASVRPAGELDSSAVSRIW
jgi:glycine/D-amino acid oxidase-like deaminating enzyme